MSSPIESILRSVLTVAILVCAATFSRAAFSVLPITSFGTNPHGSYPSAGLILGPKGNYYGTTQSGGAYGQATPIDDAGTVFMITPSGVLTTLASFNPAVTGGYPTALVLGRDGNFYGTCAVGGPGNLGTIFKMTPAGTLTLLHAFTGADGEYPDYLIQGRDGYLYPSFASSGPVLKILPATGEVTTLNSGASNLSLYYQGADSDLYGTVYKDNGASSIVKVSSTGAITSLYSFDSYVSDVIPGPENSVYGATINLSYDGTGSIFKLTPSGNLTTLVSFSPSATNSAPGQIILGKDGNFYGTANEGIIQATPQGTVTTLAPGVNFTGIVQAPTGDLFWLTDGVGSIQRFSQGIASTLYTFNGENVGTPTGPLLQGGDGNFYGTGTSGSLGYGGIYRVTPSGELSTIAPFSEPTYPFGVTQGGDGNFYGVTRPGIDYSEIPPTDSSFFKITPSGTATILHPFMGTGPETPNSSLVDGGDGDLYGLTSDGGTSNLGTFYRISPSGTLTVLASLDSTMVDSTEPGTPFRLILGHDGNFYALTNAQKLIRITPTGNVKVVATFSLGSFLQATGFAQDPGGNFYFTSEGSGPSNQGQLLKVAPNGTLTAVYSFGYEATVQSYFPTSLARAKNGNFYVTVQSIDANGTGGLMQITPGGVATLLPYGAIEGDNPDSVIAGTDGTLYGTTQAGGRLGAGMLFHVNPDLLSGTIIGTPGSFSYQPGNTIDKVFDGDLSTYFDAPSPGNGDWVGLDLGSPQNITAIAYAPRVHFESRMLGGVFQGSNTPDFSSGVVNLAPPIKDFPHDGFNTVIVSGSYRYVRYLSPPRGYGNISELQIYSTPPPTVAP